MIFLRCTLYLVRRTWFLFWRVTLSIALGNSRWNLLYMNMKMLASFLNLGINWISLFRNSKDCWIRLWSCFDSSMEKMCSRRFTRRTSPNDYWSERVLAWMLKSPCCRNWSRYLCMLCACYFEQVSLLVYINLCVCTCVDNFLRAFVILCMFT